MILLLGWMACAGRPPAEAPLDPSEALERARGLRPPGAVASTLRVRADLPGRVLPGALTGSVVLDPPERLRVDVAAPIGGSVLAGVVGPEGLSVYFVRDNAWLGRSDPEAALRSLTGGALGVREAIALLTGRLPDAGRPPDRLEEGTDGPRAAWIAPGGLELVVTLSSDGLWRRLEVLGPDGLLAEAERTGRERVGRAPMPSAVHLELPRQDAVLDLRFESWHKADPDPSAFVLVRPPGAEELLPGTPPGP